MNEKNSIKPLVEGAFLGAIVLVLTFSSLYVPLASPFVTFIWPVPIIVLGVRHGMRFSIMATVVVAVLSAILFHPFYLLVTLLGFGLVSIILGGALEEGFSPLKTFLLGTGASFFSQLLLLWIGMRLMGFQPLEELQRTMIQVVEFYSRVGMDAQIMGEMEKMMAEQVNLIVVLFPAIFLLSAAMMAGGSYLISLHVLKRLGYNKPYPPPFREWKLPKEFALGFLFLFLVSFLLENPLLQNLLLIFFLLFFLQGLSVAYYLIRRYIRGKWPILVLLFLFFIASPLMVQIFMVSGIFDIWFDLRGLSGKKRDG